MAEKFTLVQIVSDAPDVQRGVLLERGHISYETAVENCRKFYERDLRRATEVLAALERGDVEAYHQRGVYVVRDRRRVEPTGSNSEGGGDDE